MRYEQVEEPQTIWHSLRALFFQPLFFPPGSVVSPHFKVFLLDFSSFCFLFTQWSLLLTTSPDPPGFQVHCAATPILSWFRDSVPALPERPLGLFCPPPPTFPYLDSSHLRTRPTFILSCDRFPQPSNHGLQALFPLEPSTSPTERQLPLVRIRFSYLGHFLTAKPNPESGLVDSPPGPLGIFLLPNFFLRTSPTPAVL